MKSDLVSERIKSFMRKRRLTQSELAEVSGIAQPNISEMLNGRRNILPLAEAIATNYGASRDWLLGDDIIEEVNGSPANLDVGQRKELLDKLNELYERHQEIISEEQSIMRQMLAINRMLIIGGKEVVG